MRNLGRRHCCDLHFTDKETESQRGLLPRWTQPKVQSQGANPVRLNPQPVPCLMSLGLWSQQKSRLANRYVLDWFFFVLQENKQINEIIFGGSHFLSKHGVAVILIKVLGAQSWGPNLRRLSPWTPLVLRLVPAPTCSPQKEPRQRDSPGL